jgi:hypothetical protein
MPLDEASFTWLIVALLLLSKYDIPPGILLDN